MITNNIDDKIIQVIIFTILNFIIIYCCSGIKLQNEQYFILIMISTICHMFVNTYYPQIIIK